MSLSTSLTRLALDHRLSWSEVEELLMLAEADIEQAERDLAFDHWWNSSILASRRYMAICDMLEPQLPAQKPASGRAIPMEVLS